MMRTHRRGHSELEVSVLGLGCMGMSEFYSTADEAASIRVLHRALELGMNFFDTADMYGPFRNENLAAAEVTLTDDELAAIEAVAPRGFAAGTRYPEAAMDALDG